MGFALVMLSMLLAGACWFDIGSAGAFAFLAQVPAALGIALLRGTRGKARLGRDALSLALLWAGGFALAGLLAAWPLQALRASPGLLPTLAMSGASAVVLLLLWRHWPLWHGIEREGGALGLRYSAQDRHERSAWSGLQVAVPVLLLLGGGIALAWPGLLAGDARTIAAIAYAALLPLAHALLQSAPARLLVHGLLGAPLYTALILQAQSWAGAGWGGQILPRVGMEVVVTFLGGDVDRPLVTGCVYNATHPLPFSQPAELTKTGLRSQSSPGGEGFHEISIDDARGAELLYIRAHKRLHTNGNFRALQ